MKLKAGLFQCWLSGTRRASGSWQEATSPWACKNSQASHSSRFIYTRKAQTIKIIINICINISTYKGVIHYIRYKNTAVYCLFNMFNTRWSDVIVMNIILRCDVHWIQNKSRCYSFMYISVHIIYHIYLAGSLLYGTRWNIKSAIYDP